MATQYQTITLNLEPLRHLGIIIDGGVKGIHVDKIVPGGPVALDGRIQQGDEIIQINKEPLLGMTVDQAYKFMRTAVERSGTITLLISKTSKEALIKEKLFLEAKLEHQQKEKEKLLNLYGLQLREAQTDYVALKRENKELREKVAKLEKETTEKDRKLMNMEEDNVYFETQKEAYESEVLRLHEKIAQCTNDNMETVNEMKEECEILKTENGVLQTEVQRLFKEFEQTFTCSEELRQKVVELEQNNSEIESMAAHRDAQLRELLEKIEKAEEKFRMIEKDGQLRYNFNNFLPDTYEIEETTRTAAIAEESEEQDAVDAKEVEEERDEESNEKDEVEENQEDYLNLANEYDSDETQLDSAKEEEEEHEEDKEDEEMKEEGEEEEKEKKVKEEEVAPLRTIISGIYRGADFLLSALQSVQQEQEVHQTPSYLQQVQQDNKAPNEEKEHKIAEKIAEMKNVSFGKAMASFSVKMESIGEKLSKMDERVEKIEDSDGEEVVEARMDEVEERLCKVEERIEEKRTVVL